MHKKSNDGQKAPADCGGVVNAFRSTIVILQTPHVHSLNNICNMDQVMVRMNTPATCTNSTSVQVASVSLKQVALVAVSLYLWRPEQQELKLRNSRSLKRLQEGFLLGHTRNLACQVSLPHFLPGNVVRS